MSAWNIAGETLAFLTILTIIGNPLRHLLVRPSDVEGPTPSIAVRWMLSLASGIAVLPLLFLNLGLIPGTVGPITVWIVLVVALGANLFLYRKRIPRIPIGLRKLWSFLSAGDRWFGAILLVILAFQMSGLVGLWVTPGDDVKLYSLITQRFIDVHGIPQDWGMFALPSWFNERAHLLLPGFSSIAAGMVYFIGNDVPTTVSILTSVFRCLPAASLFVLVFAVTKRTIPALLGMAIFGLSVVEPPIAWFAWGGQAELSAVSILPIACAAVYVIYRQEIRSWRFLLWTALIIGGMSLLHPFAFFYFLAFLLTLTAIGLWKRKLVTTAAMWLPSLIGLGLAAAPILQAVAPEAAISGYYSSTNAGWTPIFGWTMSPLEAAASLEGRVVALYGTAAVGVLLLGLLVAREIGAREKAFVSIFGGWFLLIFLLHENNPNGLFLIRFPLWYRIDANRTFDVTSLAAAATVGVILDQIFWKTLPRRTAGAGSPWRTRIWTRADGRTRLVAIAVVGLLLGGQFVVNATVLGGYRGLSPVQSDDVRAFDWIRTRTPPDAVFFVNQADAGSWIPAFAERRVVFPFGVVTNYSLLGAYQSALAAFVSDPGSFQSVQFMESTEVTYIYAGPARIYNRPGFDPAKIQAAGLYDLVFHQGSVWIFRLKPITISWLWTADLSNINRTAIYATDNYTLTYTSQGLEVDARGPGYVGLNFSVSPPVAIGRTPYLLFSWYTDAGVYMSVDVNTVRVLDRQSSAFWMTSAISLSRLGIPRVNNVVVSIDGTGSCFVASIGIAQMGPT